MTVTIYIIYPEYVKLNKNLHSGTLKKNIIQLQIYNILFNKYTIFFMFKKINLHFYFAFMVRCVFCILMKYIRTNQFFIYLCRSSNPNYQLHSLPMYRIFSLLIINALLAFSILSAQTARLPGLRENTPSVFAFTNAHIITSPGQVQSNATMVIRDGVIEDIGRRAKIPADAWIIDLEGKTVYPGFIDMFSNYGLPDTMEMEEHIHWNAQVRSHFRSAEAFMPDAKTASLLRSGGFTAVQTTSPVGLLKGFSAVVGLGEGDANRQIIRQDVAQSISFRRSDRRSRAYPTSTMGAIALVRQTMLDADWYAAAHQNFNANHSQERPESNRALESIAGARQANKAFIFETPDENFLLRADALAKEFGLTSWIMGSGSEYRRLETIRQTGLPLIVPLNFPEEPKLATPEESRQVSLENLRHWYLAPENPARLADARITMALSSYGSEKNFLKNLRASVMRGLAEQDALAALTTTPARMLGIDNRYGTLEKGKAASFFITDGNIFENNKKILEVWVDGTRYLEEPPAEKPQGKWLISSRQELDDAKIDIKSRNNRLSGSIEYQEKSVRLQHIEYDKLRLVMHFQGDSIGMDGLYRLSANLSGDEMLGSGADARGNMFNWSASRELAHEQQENDQQEQGQASQKQQLMLPERYPSMEYGQTTPPEQPRHLLIKNATLWTQGDDGIIENADMLITRGIITKIGFELEAPTGALVIDAEGKHVTPGLIDPHLHTSITGGVNETGDAITSETRISDVIHGDNVWIYRLLAGGITSGTLFHGSANPIGGQSAVIKMRHGELPDALLINDAKPGLKFALGENVKGMSTRYPNSRQGTEQIIKDGFRAARDYEQALLRQEIDRDAMPVRRDLQLEAILEMIRGDRSAHVHAYRQDEMLMMMRLAEEYGFTITSFEHTLEGYKIADELRDHGAAAVVWSDWSSFKVEAHDGILHNARLLNEVGVLTSLHSDNTQLSTRMNWEAAKTVKTGVSEIDAMNFITLHPAIIMGIDHRVGSLEPGKDADFIIWNGHPLSSLSIPQQTWVDGKKYFDREDDKLLRVEVKEERTLIINSILGGER
jgi:imidazolonepropionase-like amidohydrolase